MIDLNLGNYYGDVEAVEIEGSYFLQLDCWNGTGQVEISEELYKLIESEFG